MKPKQEEVDNVPDEISIDDTDSNNSDQQAVQESRANINDYLSDEKNDTQQHNPLVNDPALVDETISLNDTKMSIEKANKYDILSQFIIPHSVPSRKRSNSQVNCISAENFDEIKTDTDEEEAKSVSNSQQFQSPLANKFAEKCMTSRKDPKKLMDSDSSNTCNRITNIQLLRRFSEMKSKLPDSHLPINKDKDSPKHEKLANKLQDLDFKPEKQSAKEYEISHKAEIFSMDFPEESLEELEKIDAELARANNADSYSFSSDEETTLLYENINLPPIKKGLEYTLVLDLDETLIHYNDEGFYLVRPGVPTLLSELSKYYELIIFTAALKDYADLIIDQIDPQRYITHRLYRQHCTPDGEFHVKDIVKLGRGLEKILIIDNLAESFQRQPENGILVKDWFDDMEDNELAMLIPFLRSLVESKVQDVREEIRKVLAYGE